MEISHTHVVFKDKLVIEESTISTKEKQFKKQRVKREDAAAVLILNTDTNKLILTKQFRYPIHDKVTDSILEIVAGKIDGDEEPIDAAIREGEEETGYRIRKEKIRQMMSCFSSPGYSSECFYIFYATVTDADKVSKGGGLANENESIQVIEMDSEAFIELIKTSHIQDAKTYVAGLYFANYI